MTQPQERPRTSRGHYYKSVNNTNIVKSNEEERMDFNDPITNSYHEIRPDSRRNSRVVKHEVAFDSNNMETNYTPRPPSSATRDDSNLTNQISPRRRMYSASRSKINNHNETENHNNQLSYTNNNKQTNSYQKYVCSLYTCKKERHFSL